MNRPTHEDLLGFVLGALDADQAQQIEQCIEEDPALLDEIMQCRVAVAPLDSLKAHDSPPIGLARRTCQFVAQAAAAGLTAPGPGASRPRPQARENDYRDDAQSEPSQFPSGRDGRAAAGSFGAAVPFDRPSGRHGLGEVPTSQPGSPRRLSEAAGTQLLVGSSSWALVDVIAVAAVMTVIAAVIIPALSHSRFQARMVACQNNLVQIGRSLLEHAESHGGNFIAIPDDPKFGVAGYYAPALIESGRIDSPSVFFCEPQHGAAAAQSTIPTLKQVRNATGRELAQLQRQMGGAFAYTLGYQHNGVYQPHRNLGRPLFVVMADAPSTDLPGRRSLHHDGKGQNCLFEDGHVRFMTSASIGSDAIFENDLGLLAPGVHADDMVVGHSQTPIFAEPLLLRVEPDASESPTRREDE